jgi:tetratricopeptide (TPR) repeat protein
LPPAVRTTMSIVPYGNALRALGRHDAAAALDRRLVIVLERQIAWAPEDTRARVILGINYSHLGRLEEAYQQIEKAVEMGVSDPHSLYNIACFYALNGRKREALAMLETRHRCRIYRLGSCRFGSGSREPAWRTRVPTLARNRAEQRMRRAHPGPARMRPAPHERASTCSS